MNDENNEIETVKDPVCGMEIEKRDLKSEHNSVTYYFCSDSCKQKFDRDPDQFAV